MIERVGQRIGNYQLSRLLGHGGFADVYLGEHIYLKTLAAIKILHAQLANENIEQFRIEAQTIAHLVHPHIIRVLDFDVDQRTPLLVMDYAPDGTLRQRHPKGERLSLPTVVPYVKQIASALQYAHDRKLIHRDVKPENMLIGHNGEVLLSDFGIALMSETSLSQSTEDTVMGTMAYMSPEQIQGKARPASDQYALAVIVYEWLCGVRPFTGSYMEVVTQHLSTAPPPMQNYAAISPDVEHVILKALEKDPHERFARVQDFADALEQAYEGSLGTTPPAVNAVYATPLSKKKEESVNHPPTFSSNPTPISRATAPIANMGSLQDTVVTPREYIIPKVKKRAGRVIKQGVRVLVVIIILASLLLCGLGYGAIRLYSNFTSSNSGSSTSTSSNSTSGTAAALYVAHNFLQDLSHQSYTQAYNNFASTLADQVSLNSFLAEGRLFDRCDGSITQYIQDSNPQIQNGTEKYTFTVTRTKLTQAYKLYLTTQNDADGTWHISNYTSSIQMPSC